MLDTALIRRWGTRGVGLKVGSGESGSQKAGKTGRREESREPVAGSREW